METLIHFKDFLDELSKDNSRLYKMEVLKQYKDDDVVKYYLNYVYNPYIVTGISNKKLNRQVEVDYSTNFNTLKEILDYAKEHNTGSDKDLSIIFTNRDTIMENSSVEDLAPYMELFNKILIKNLQLGVEVLSINKCIPGLIPTFDVMLANSYFDKPEVVEGKEFALTTKLDGGRIIAIKDNGVVSFWTRAGQKYEGLVDLEKEMMEKMEDGIALDGEILIENRNRFTSKEQYKETMKITRKDGEKHGVKMYVFDIMAVKSFKTQYNDMPYSLRRTCLDIMFESHDFKYFELLPILYRGKDTSEITKWLNYNTEHGEEGIMINICDAPYEFKRTNNLLKCKKMHDIDLPILGFEEGENRNKGRLGAIITEYEGNKVKVGNGFSQELRDTIWKNRENYLYRMMRVQYFEITKNEKGELSLRFPVFIDFRDDK